MAADGVTATLQPGGGERREPADVSHHGDAERDGGGALNNYNITNAGAEFTINKRPITVTADAKSKVYGNGDPALTYLPTNQRLAGIRRRVQRFAERGRRARNVGQHYAISAGNADGRRQRPYVAASLAITARPITVTADAKSKVRQW